MNSKLFIFIIVLLIGIIILFGYLNSAKEKDLSPSKLNVDKCNALVYNGEGRINLLFISSSEDAKSYSELLFDTEPYNNYRDYFNIYHIEGDPICDSYQDIAILCNTQEVKDIEKNCPHDYTIVVKDEPEHIRSSAYVNKISLNRNAPLSVLIHEMGHLFNLAEEYLSNSPPPRGSKNCQKSCESFENLADSCSKECSQTSLYRSITQGVMRSLLTTNYGGFNIDLISKALEKRKPSNSYIAGSQILEQSSCNQESFVDIELIKEEESISVISKNEIVKGCATSNSFLDISYEEVTCFNEVCYNADAVFTDTGAKNEEVMSGETFSPPKTTTISIPYSHKELTITDNGEKIATISLSQAGVTACKI